MWAEKLIDPSGFPITVREAMLNLQECTHELKSGAIAAARVFNKTLPPGTKRGYACLIWIEVSTMKAGKS